MTKLEVFTALAEIRTYLCDGAGSDSRAGVRLKPKDLLARVGFDLGAVLTTLEREIAKGEARFPEDGQKGPAERLAAPAAD